jgi:hypothetical protein
MTMHNDQKPSPRIFRKRHGTPEACGCGDNRGGVCLDGATSFVKCGFSQHGRPSYAVDFWLLTGKRVIFAPLACATATAR